MIEKWKMKNINHKIIDRNMVVHFKICQLIFLIHRSTAHLSLDFQFLIWTKPKAAYEWILICRLLIYVRNIPTTSTQHYEGVCSTILLKDACVLYYSQRGFPTEIFRSNLYEQSQFDILIIMDNCIKANKGHGKDLVWKLSLREAAKNILRGGGSLNLAAFGHKVPTPPSFTTKVTYPP